ncbi:hypothetical protein BC332_08167 [Capsicum chinense]|nr:hypothetical protein BC332_08167 [Capsicum chinense]
MGDFIEEGIKSGKIQSMVALQAASKDMQTGSINVQLRKPITVQTYLPRVIVTTLATKRFDYDTKAVPWDYRAKAKGKMLDVAAAKGMTRYQPKTGLGSRADGMVEPIHLKHQRGTRGLGYELISREACSERFRIKVFVPTQVTISGQTIDEDIIEGIENLFVAVIEEESVIDFKKLTIRDAEPGEFLQNWTISTFLFRQESW